MSNKNSTALHFRNYLSANLTLKAFAFITIPIMTRILTPTDYGLLAVFSSISGLLQISFSLSIYTAISRYYYENKPDFSEFFTTSIFVTILIFIINAVLLILFRQSFAPLFGLPTNLFPYLIPAIYIIIIGNIYDGVFQPQNKSGRVAFRNIAQTVTTFSLSVIIIINLSSNKYLGSVIGSSISGLLISVFLIYQLSGYYKFSFSKTHLKYIFRFSLPLCLYDISGLFLSQFDRIIINSKLGSYEAGLYSFSSNVGMILFLISSSLYQAWMPKYFEYMNTGNDQKHKQDITTLVRIIIFCGAGLFFFGGEIGMLLAPTSFSRSLNIIPINVFSMIIYSLSFTYLRNFQYEKRNIFLTITTVLSGGISIALNYLLIPIMGFIGSSFSAVIAYTSLLIISYIFSKYFGKHYTVPLSLIIKPLLLSSPFFIVFFVIKNLPLPLFIFIKLSLLIILLYLLFKNDSNLKVFLKRNSIFVFKEK